MLLAVL